MFFINEKYIEIYDSEFTFDDLADFYGKNNNPFDAIKGWIIRDEEALNKLKELKKENDKLLDRKSSINLIFGVPIFSRIEIE